MLKIKKNPDVTKCNEVTNAVNQNDGYCPCMVFKNEDTKCMCKMFREQEYAGPCHCGRFVKVEE